MQSEIVERVRSGKPTEISRRPVFAIVWLGATIIIAWQLVEGQRSFETPGVFVTLFLLLCCTLSILLYIPNPVQNLAGSATDRCRLIFILIGAAVVLFPLPNLIGGPLLFVLPVIALIELAMLKQPIRKREAFYAAGLALLAGVAGLGAGWIRWLGTGEWSILQILLVLTSLLAGWGVLRSSGLLQSGVGRSRFLAEGAVRGAPRLKIGGFRTHKTETRHAAGSCARRFRLRFGGPRRWVHECDHPRDCAGAGGSTPSAGSAEGHGHLRESNGRNGHHRAGQAAGRTASRAPPDLARELAVSIAAIRATPDPSMVSFHVLASVRYRANGRVVQDETADHVLALIAPASTFGCELRVCGAKGELLRRVALPGQLARDDKCPKATQ
jgi:hypothetical protein